jgi:uracil phosphoribosyltransferase
VSTVHVLDDAVSGVHLGRLRDVTTAPPAFRAHAHALGALLAVTALHDVPAASTQVNTPLASAPATQPAVPVAAIPVLRAGLGLLSGVLEVVPSAVVGMIGLERDPTTLEPREYYVKLPDLAGTWALVLEPMLATGGSAATAARYLHDAGAQHVIVCSVVATEQACTAIHAKVPGAGIVTAALDPSLDDNGYIVPGLGDFGDRLFGTHH